MSRARFSLQIAIGMAILLSAAAVAQENQPRRSSATQDVFAAVQENLYDAADRTLALVFADQPCRQARPGAERLKCVQQGRGMVPAVSPGRWLSQTQRDLGSHGRAHP